jgi:pimeloyl-ACP methyl ester carboxylesterase
MKPQALIDVGNGPAVIFCHGALMDSSMFERQTQALSPRFRCISYDLRPITEAPYSLSDLVDGCLNLADELEVERFVLAGLSMGGFLGMELAFRQDQRLVGLILMDTMAADYTADERTLFSSIFDPLDTDGLLPKSFIDQFVPVIFSQNAEYEQPSLIEHWTKRWGSRSARSILNEHRAWMAKDDYRPRLAEIEVPTLILHGRDDRGIIFHHAEVLHQGISGSTLIGLERAGHAITEETPDRVNQALSDFLGRLPAW